MDTKKQTAYVLYWKYSDGSGFGIVRAYTDKERAEQDLELAQMNHDKEWGLEVEEVPLVGQLYDPNTLR